MAFDSTTGIISAPVDMGDIADALGVDSLDLGTLCESEEVNMWSARKPMRSSNMGILTDAQIQEQNYGITPPCGKWWQLMDLADASRRFVYAKPRGSDYQEWYRMLDFDGYNHKATPAEIRLTGDATIYAGINATLRLVIYLSTNQEIGLSDFRMKVGDMATHPTLSLDLWNVMILYKVGSNYYLYNSGMTTSETSVIELSISGERLKVGDTVKVMAVLAYDSAIPAGETAISVANGDYSHDWFIPLNITDSFEGERSYTVLEYSVFNGFSVIYEKLTLPASQKNYYSFGSYFVFSTFLTDKTQLTHTFRYEIYIKRGNSVLQNASSRKEATITFSLGATTERATYNFGNVIFNPITTTQTGDELYLKVTCISTPTDIVLWDKVIYNY